MTVSKETIIRTALLVLALINQILTSTGHSVLPFDDEMVTEIISLLLTVVTSAAAWWKNNSFTEEALKADEYLKNLKEGR